MKKIIKLNYILPIFMDAFRLIAPSWELQKIIIENISIYRNGFGISIRNMLTKNRTARSFDALQGRL